MSNKYIKKNLRLGLEFDTYIMKHPSAYKKIPQKAMVILTDKNDSVFTRESLDSAEQEHAHHRISYIEAQKSGSRWNIRPLTLS